MAAGSKKKDDAAAGGNGYVDLDSLLGQGLPQEDVEIEGVGKFRVRALTREEALKVGDIPEGKGHAGKVDREILRHGLVNPELSYQDIEKLSSRLPAGALEPVVEAIARMSGFFDSKARKEAMLRFPS